MDGARAEAVGARRCTKSPTLRHGIQHFGGKEKGKGCAMKLKWKVALELEHR